MMDAADARGSIIKLSRPSLHVFHEFLDCAARYLLLNCKKKRRLLKESDWCDRFRIIGELAVDLRIDRQDCSVGHRERMSVRRGADESIDCDAAIAPGRFSITTV